MTIQEAFDEFKLEVQQGFERVGTAFGHWWWWYRWWYCGTSSGPTKIPGHDHGQVSFTVPAGSKLLIVEGAGAMDEGVDYVINGTTLTWLSYTALDTTDVLYVF